MPNFSNNESYKHKYAKDLFKEWCDSSSWVSDGGWSSISTNYEYNNGEEVTLNWRSNRMEDAWLEYPIVVNDNINSIESNWDEIWPGFVEDEDGNPKDERLWNGFVPNYNECKDFNLHPLAVIDIVLPHKGQIAYLIEICHKNPVSNEKLEKLKKLNCSNSFKLIEIDADWILRQTGVPSKLEIKRWLI